MVALFDIEDILYQDYQDYKNFLLPSINLRREIDGLQPMDDEEAQNDFLDNYLKRNDCTRTGR